MVESPYTATQFTTMVRSVRFPVPTDITKSRYAVHAANKNFFGIELLQARWTFEDALPHSIAVQKFGNRRFVSFTLFLFCIVVRLAPVWAIFASPYFNLFDLGPLASRDIAGIDE
jgi:hypothetical protein